MNKSIAVGILLIFYTSACKKDTSNNINQNVVVSDGGQSSFQRTVGAGKLSSFNSVKQTRDSGYIFCGFTENETVHERDIYLVKTNAKGATVWSKHYFGSEYDNEGWFVDITTDHGFIIAATSTLHSGGYDPPPYNGLLIKTDSIGNQLWQKSFSFGNATSITTIRHTMDGGYIACGTEYGTKVGILLKTDASGNESWRKTYGSLVNVNQIDNTTDGGFILCGSIQDSLTGSTENYIIRTNSIGDTLWTKKYGDNYDNSASAIKQTSTGSFILSGYNTNHTNGGAGFAMLLNSNGDRIWNNNFLNLNIASLDFITTTGDNQFIAVGRQSFGSSTQAYLLKMDGSGNEVWIKSFNQKSYNLFAEVQQTFDDGFILAGYTFGYGYIVKTDVNGN